MSAAEVWDVRACSLPQFSAFGMDGAIWAGVGDTVVKCFCPNYVIKREYMCWSPNCICQFLWRQIVMFSPSQIKICYMCFLLPKSNDTCTHARTRRHTHTCRQRHTTVCKSAQELPGTSAPHTLLPPSTSGVGHSVVGPRESFWWPRNKYHILESEKGSTCTESHLQTCRATYIDIVHKGIKNYNC